MGRTMTAACDSVLTVSRWLQGRAGATVTEPRRCSLPHTWPSPPAARASARRDSGWTALLDQWGARFMEELDYTREAANASYVARQLSSLEGVVVPKPVATLSTGTVLVADWIEGERLSESTADDVLTLCTTLLNAYLVQLLEIGEVSGRLHGDAHEG